MWRRLASVLVLILLVGWVWVPSVYAGSDGAVVTMESNRLQPGIDLYSSRSYNAAAQYFEKSVRADPRNPTAYYYSAMCFAQLGQNDRARETYELIVKYFPGSPEAKNAGIALRGMPSASPAAATAAGAKKSSAANSGNDHPGDVLPDSDAVPFTRVGGTIYVNAIVNGRPIRMIFDTGADHVQIGLNHISTLQAAAQAGRHTKVQGVGGLSDVSEANAQITLGKITRTCPILIQDKMRTEPLLGQTFFQQYLCQFDNGAGLIRFYRRSSARDYNAGYDTIEVPYSQSGNNLVVYPKIMVGGETYTVPMFLDTGAERTMISRLMLPVSIPQDARLYRVSGISGSETVVEVPVQKLELGTISKVGMKVLMSGGMINLLGQDFFGDRKYTVDPEKKVIRFSRN